MLESLSRVIRAIMKWRGEEPTQCEKYCNTYVRIIINVITSIFIIIVIYI